MQQRLIKAFPDGSSLFYGKGKYDWYCVYLCTPEKQSYAIKDEEVFVFLQELSRSYKKQNILNDIKSFYNTINSNDRNQEPEEDVLNEITYLSQKYGKYTLQVDKYFSFLYAAMFSEERKKNTKLGKRIKLLGVHMTLCGEYNMLKKMRYFEKVPYEKLDEMCRIRGF